MPELSSFHKPDLFLHVYQKLEVCIILCPSLSITPALCTDIENPVALRIYLVMLCRHKEASLLKPLCSARLEKIVKKRELSESSSDHGNVFLCLSSTWPESGSDDSLQVKGR